MNRKLKLMIVMLAASGLLAGIAVAAASPSVTTGKATSITSSSAVLNGTINPNGNTAHYEFQIGLTNSYSGAVAARHGVSGTKAVAVKLAVSHLLPGTVYHYRLDATNGSGSSTGSDRTFRTAGNPPPEAATGAATNIGSMDATLTGVINPHNQETTYRFQIGTSTAYDLQTPDRTVPAGNQPVTVAVPVNGLGPATLYHFRLVALHGSSVVADGADATFFTEPAKPAAAHVQAHTTPHQSPVAPFVFKTSGKLVGPSSFPHGTGCFDNAIVRFFLGHRRVAATVVSIQPDCSFSGQTVFNHLPRHRHGVHKLRLRVVIHFNGNGYLAPADSGVSHVVLG
jgi:hypothetical protein